jgi:diguanylate cyclase (GGDEF)-like protein
MGPAPPTRPRAPSSGRRFWLVAAAALVVIGSIGSILAARAVSRTEDERSRQGFIASSMEIASTLQLALQHEQDLVITMGAFVDRNPGASQAQFAQWTNAVRALERYPEVLGVAELVLVPASQLDAFAARAMADPTGPLGPGGTFVVSPAGNRPYYCFDSASLSRTPTTIPAGLDYCDTGLGPQLLKARDSGLPAYVPYRTGHADVLVLGTPVYRGGDVPDTIQARRDAFIGWTGVSLQPDVILSTALAHHPSTAVAFRYESKSSTVSFRAGSIPSGAQSTTMGLANGWHVQVFGARSGGGITANTNALTLLVGGIVVSLLLAFQLYLLGTSRSRALRLVDERTDELHHQAFHDPLTGLPNRALILDRAGQMLAHARRERTPAAAFFLDLDDFKDINDTLGHKAGDQVLVVVATRLESAVRQGDTVGRLGGDEFVVLAQGASLRAGADGVADRILEALRPPIEISDSETPLTVTASIGIAEGERSTPDELLRDADIALYQAKAAGKHCAVSFSRSMQESVDDHRRLEVDLHRALDAGQFFLLYQPTVHLATGAVNGVEALIRWRHPERGIVGPDEFIPALESSGLIVPVGQWVVDTACRQGAAWEKLGYRISVSVNVSAVQMERDRIVDDVFGALEASGFDPSLLILELTETAVMHDVQASLSRLTLLKAIGVDIAIDDFGTGYSSLAYLRQFPIDVFKVDQSFVEEMTRSSEAAAIVHTLVQLGKQLDLRIIAEGIETEDQLERLRAEGVDIGQGFLFAHPLEANGVDQLLAENGAGRLEDHRVLH